MSDIIIGEINKSENFVSMSKFQEYIEEKHNRSKYEIGFGH